MLSPFKIVQNEMGQNHEKEPWKSRGAVKDKPLQNAWNVQEKIKDFIK